MSFWSPNKLTELKNRWHKKTNEKLLARLNCRSVFFSLRQQNNRIFSVYTKNWLKLYWFLCLTRTDRFLFISIVLCVCVALSFLRRFCFYYGRSLLHLFLWRTKLRTYNTSFNFISFFFYSAHQFLLLLLILCWRKQNEKPPKKFWPIFFVYFFFSDNLICSLSSFCCCFFPCFCCFIFHEFTFHFHHCEFRFFNFRAGKSAVMAAFMTQKFSFIATNFLCKWLKCVAGINFE